MILECEKPPAPPARAVLLFKHLHDLLFVVILGFSTLLQFPFSPFLHSESGEPGEVIPTLFLLSSVAYFKHANT